MSLLILKILFSVIMSLWTRVILLALRWCALVGSPLCVAHPVITSITWECLLLLSFPVKQWKQASIPEKCLKKSHVEICSLRNKVHEINNWLVTDDIHILAISETHLDNTFDGTVVAIHGYNIYGKDWNANGGGAAVYIPNHIPVKIREDLMLNTVDVIWLQVHLPHYWGKLM